MNRAFCGRGENGSIVVLKDPDTAVSGVQCRFEAKHNDVIAKLRPGLTASVRGKVIAFRFSDVLMDDCELLKD